MSDLDLRYVCTECDTQTDAPPCKCGNAALMDLHDPDTRLMLEEEHARAVSRHAQRLIVVSIPIGVALTVILAAVLPDGRRIIHFLPFGGGFIAWCCALTMGSAWALGRAWRGPRRPAYLG